MQENLLKEHLPQILPKFTQVLKKFLKRIANEIDKQLPKGERWHTDLLTQMAERRPERPPIITKGIQRKLGQLLRFRHKVNNIYGDELIYEKAEEHAKPNHGIIHSGF